MTETKETLVRKLEQRKNGANVHMVTKTIHRLRTLDEKSERFTRLLHAIHQFFESSDHRVLALGNWW